MRRNESSLIPAKNENIFCEKIHGREDLERSDYESVPITELWNTLKRCSTLKSYTEMCSLGSKTGRGTTSVCFAYL